MANKSGVGYRRPPKHTQFKKGQSGNPSGRPKGTVNLATALYNTLREPVEMVEDGITKTMTKMEAAVKRLVEEAINGDMHAFRVLSVLSQAMQEAEGSATSTELEGADKKILETLFRRFAPAGAAQS